MNAGPHQQDGTRRPAADVPSRDWRQMEETIGHAGHGPTVHGYKQTGSRTPPPQEQYPGSDYPELPEPPEEPPILTNPPKKYPPPQYAGKPHDDPGQSYQPKPHNDCEPYPEKPADDYPPHQEPGGGHGDHPQHGGDPHGGGHPGHGEPAGGQAGEHEGPQEGATQVVASPPRQNQRNLTPETRRELCRRVLDYIASGEDPVGYHRNFGHVHGTPEFLPWHRQFLRRFEEWQRLRLEDPSAFIPLAFWDPADPIPSEFPYERRANNIPSLDLAARLPIERLPTLDYQTFSAELEQHHNQVHGAIGGDMTDPRVSPNDPCFWLFHAYIDNVFAQWEAMRAS